MQQKWRRHGPAILRLAAIGMTLAALVWLGYQFWRLLWQPDPMGAIDLKLRYVELHAWLAGEKVYGELGSAVYPPASYLLLWPFLGWNSLEAARWLWGATSVLALVWLVATLLRECGCETRSERVFVALIPLSMYATGATIGNGQLVVHILPVLLASLLLLRSTATWSSDLLIGSLFVLALVKPNVTAPFFWIVLFARGRWRAALLVVLGYFGLTLWAASYQDGSAIDLMLEWYSQAQSGIDWGNEHGGYANQSRWLAQIGLDEWTSLASLFVLFLSGIWIYVHRRLDLWVLVGATALVARFWTYHPWYDDLLVLLPLIALFRIAKGDESPRRRIVAGVLSGCLLITLLAPGGLYLFPMPWKSLYVGAQIATWTVVLLFLVQHAWRLQHPHHPTAS